MSGKELKASVSWGPATAIIGTFAIFLGAQIIAGLAVSVYPAIKDWDAAAIERWFRTSVWAQFFIVGLVQTVSLGLLALVLKRFRSSFRALGLKLPGKEDVLLALGGYGVYILSIIVVMGAFTSLFPQLPLDQRQEVGFENAAGPALVLVFAALVIMPAVVEEILVRGFLYLGIRTKLPVVKAAIVTSLVFAAAHLQFGSGNPLVWSAAIDTFFLSLVLIYLREKTGSLAAPITLHLIKNSVAFTALFIIAGQ